MNDGSIANMKPSIADDMSRRIRIFIVSLHDDVTTHNDFTHRLAVMQDLLSLRIPFRISSAALAMLIRTVGAAQNVDIDSVLIRSKIAFGSTFLRQTCAPPTAVTIQTNVHPFAWNIGSVHRYRSEQVMWEWTSV